MPTAAGYTPAPLQGGVTTSVSVPVAGAPGTQTKVAAGYPNPITGQILGGAANLAGAVVQAATPDYSGLTADQAYWLQYYNTPHPAPAPTPIAQPAPAVPPTPVQNTVSTTSNMNTDIKYAPTDIAVSLLGMGGPNAIPQINYKPNQVIPPDATAQLPDDGGWNMANRTVSDATPFVYQPNKSGDGGDAIYPPGTLIPQQQPVPQEVKPLLAQVPAQASPRALDDVLDQPLPPQPAPEPQPAPAPQPVYVPQFADAGWQEGPLSQNTMPPVAPGPQQYVPQQPTLDPAAAAAQTLYNTMPGNDPEYQEWRRRQALMHQYAAQQAMQGPPQVPTMPRAPGARGGFGGFMERMSMLNPQTRVANQQLYNKAAQSYTQMYGDQSQNWRQYMQSATQIGDQGLSQAGQNARAIFEKTADLMKEAFKDNNSGQITQNQVYEAGSKIAEAFPPGPQRDMAIAAAGRAGIDLSPWRDVPQSQKAISQQEGRDWRNKLNEQMFGQREYMNPVQREMADLREKRLEATNPDFIRYSHAKADLAETKSRLAATYGDAQATAALTARANTIQNQIFSQANSALAKANTVESQYQNAMRNAYQDPRFLDDKTGGREQVLKGIEAQFGKIDPATGVPADVLNARHVSNELNAEIGATRMKPGQQPARPAPTAQPKVAQPAAPISVPNAQALLNRARQEIPNGTPDQIKARARQLAGM